MTHNNPEIPFENGSLRLYVTIQGVMVGLAGMIHGFAETLQGNRPTEGRLLVDVGAFTLIPNYLATGIAAMRRRWIPTPSCTLNRLSSMRWPCASPM